MRASAAVLLTFIVLCLAAGCGASTGPAAGGDTTQQQAQSSGSKAPDGARTVTMNGRSVMGGWMQHWGFTWEGPVEKNGYWFDYKELDGNAMPSSFSGNVSGLAPGSVAFFKFCFADFDGSNLAAREKEVEEVIATAKEKGLKLIIGNALPVRKQDGSPELVDEYEKYNAFLLQKAASDPNVWIYDFYGPLAGQDGFLNPSYDTGDSHPNDEAYTVLDDTFFPLLDKVSQGQR
jgi:hypothetical protein